MDENKSDDIRVIASPKLFAEKGAEIDAAIETAIREALLRHKQAGNSVAVWRDEKITLLQPHEILSDSDK